MHKRLILTALVLGFSVVLFSQVNPDSLPEKYVPKVIIQAKRGSRPEEFGIELNTVIGAVSYCPCGLTIDRKKIYIFDPVNGRICVYSIKGSFLKSIELKNHKIDKCFINPGYNVLERDNEGNFYLLGYDSPSGGSKILKFDSTGNFIKVLCKSPVDEEANKVPIHLPTSISRIKERHDSLNSLLKGYKALGERTPSHLKVEYDSLENILENFLSKVKRKEPLRIPFEPWIRIEGDTLIVIIGTSRVAPNPKSAIKEGVRLFYIDKNSGNILKEQERTKENVKRIIKWRYYEDYAETIKDGVGLDRKLRKFVLSSRHNTAIISAHGFDEEGNFYELLVDTWLPDKGVKVIKWEKVK